MASAERTRPTDVRAPAAPDGFRSPFRGQPPPASNDDSRPSAFPELDCVRALLGPDVLAAAEERAARVGVSPAQVLICNGDFTEEAYLRALSQAIGSEFEPLSGTPRAQCPLTDGRLIEAAAAGVLPLETDEGLQVVVAPRGKSVQRILALAKNDPALVRRFRFTTSKHFMQFILHHAGEALSARARTQLSEKWPLLSAAPPAHPVKFFLGAALLITALIAALACAPASILFPIEILVAMLFFIWLGLRLAGAWIKPRAALSSDGSPDSELPTYTVIAALYHEARSVDGLLRAIERLDYPREKLNVIFAVEADDRETQTAITACTKRLPVTIVAVPPSQPRTKPKALNVALPFAHGTFTVVYDAEDRPEPNQLRRALHAFRSRGKKLACVQARLCIDNTADSWLARYFTAEYAGQFDIFLPGLAALDLPLPLGGTSNHFRTATLRAVGGWDAYNVTEDADLGVRLARLGYRTDVIASTTYEEAPAQISPWLRQRTRWFKGWMQTWAVHMRTPHRLLRELGLAGFVAFQLIVGGSVAAALLHPLFLAALIYSFNALRSGTEPAEAPQHFLLMAGVALAGYLAAALPGLMGLWRRGLIANGWVLLLTPVHWLLLSLAAWRALFQLAAAPYVWEKTEHGLAKNSRLADTMALSLLKLERYLSALKDSGELPIVPSKTRDISAAPPQLPRACD